MRSMGWWMGLGALGKVMQGRGSLKTDTWAEKAPPDLDLGGIPRYPRGKGAEEGQDPIPLGGRGRRGEAGKAGAWGRWGRGRDGPGVRAWAMEEAVAGPPLREKSGWQILLRV